MVIEPLFTLEKSTHYCVTIIIKLLYFENV